MKKIGICGSFDFKTNDHGGQPVKTRQLYYELCKTVGKDNIEIVEMFKKKRIKVFCGCIKAIFSCKEIIMLPAHNGLPILTLLLNLFNKLLRRKLHYVVIGGWLPEYLDSHKITAKFLKKNFSGIYVETKFMKSELNHRGFNNVHIFPNYKDINVICENDLSLVDDSPIKVCFFSRVTEKKGIEDAVRAVMEINSDSKKCLLELDIYGIIDIAFSEKFEELLKASTNYVQYKGIANPNDSVSVLKNYALQLFPTKFRTEGIPGSVVESFFAGVPVVASKWNSFDDVIDDGITGIGFEFGNYDDFKVKLQNLACDYEKINRMKKHCINAAEKYKAECKKRMEMFF